ncbi:MAG: galactoside ABC transporter permease [Bacilli bacterium]
MEEKKVCDTLLCSSYDEYIKSIESYQKHIDTLRVHGTDKIKKLTIENKSVKCNKQLDKETILKIILHNKELIVKAKEVAAENKEEISKTIKEQRMFINANYPMFKAEIVAKGKEEKVALLEKFKADRTEAVQKYVDLEASAKADMLEADSKDNSALLKVKKERKLAIDEINKAKSDGIAKIKAVQHNLFMDKQNAFAAAHDGSLPILDQIVGKAEAYAYEFDISKFLMKNGLYIIIVIFMIACIVMQPSLISWNSITDILKYFSTKVFFALGVAGLILLGGTDLSVGRMVTMSSLFTCMILNPNTTVSFFGIKFNSLYGTIGFGGTVVIALLISILACVIFSSIAGYFTAKFKIHPFISTLGTSLIIWGLMSTGTNNIKTGTVVDEALNITASVGGDFNFPLALIYAIIAIAIVWFIWNKTKFGKNMYAVGGNAEAASVSGISVFWVTMGVFIMAGVLYGIGGFLQGVTTGSSSSSFGQGWELEAIAACVIGGISFSGGIGRISGAVIGCLLFEILKLYLRGITGGNADIANIFIGVIIVVAVTFDSIKYLKKK